MDLSLILNLIVYVSALYIEKQTKILTSHYLTLKLVVFLSCLIVHIFNMVHPAYGSKAFQLVYMSNSQYLFFPTHCFFSWPVSF